MESVSWMDEKMDNPEFLGPVLWGESKKRNIYCNIEIKKANTFTINVLQTIVKSFKITAPSVLTSTSSFSFFNTFHETLYCSFNLYLTYLYCEHIT